MTLPLIFGFQSLNLVHLKFHDDCEFHGKQLFKTHVGCDLRYNTALAAAKKNWTVALALLSEVHFLRLELDPCLQTSFPV